MKPEQKCKYCQKKKFVFFVYFIVLNKWTAWAFSWMVAPSSGELGNWKKFTLQLSQNYIKLFIKIGLLKYAPKISYHVAKLGFR